MNKGVNLSGFKSVGGYLCKALCFTAIMSASQLLLHSTPQEEEGEKKAKSEQCNLGLNIPERLVTISKNDKEVVFRDTKSKAMLTFTKVGLATYDFDLESNAHEMYKEIEQDPKLKELNIRRKDLSVTECFILNWTIVDKGPNMRNDYSTMALIEVCGQYYNFTFNLPYKDRATVLPLFSQILESVESVTDEVVSE